MCKDAWSVTAVARLFAPRIRAHPHVPFWALPLRALGELHGRDVDQSRHFCVGCGIVVILQDSCFVRQQEREDPLQAHRVVDVRRAHLLSLAEKHPAAQCWIHGAEALASDLGPCLLQVREAAPAQLLVHHSGIELVASFPKAWCRVAKSQVLSDGSKENGDDYSKKESPRSVVLPRGHLSCRLQ